MSKPNPDMLDNYLHELNDDLNSSMGSDPMDAKGEQP